jgi:predicted dehydrogenase
MRVVVAGCGSIGKRHLKNLQALKVDELIGVDPREDRRREIEGAFKVPVRATLPEALKSGADAVFVTAPPVFHVPLALEAARAGCHLFIEKPLSHILDGIDELMRETETRNLVAFVGSNWKFHPGFQTMKALLDKGMIGRVTSARCQFGQYLPDWHPWEDFRKGYSARKDLGGGILLDSHEFDYLTWFLGPVTRVACFSGRVSSLEIETEDTAEVILKFASGAFGGIHLDYTQRTYQRNFEFFGEEGTIRWDVRRRAVELFEGGREGRWTVFDEPAGYDLNTMYVDEVRHFLDCIRGHTTPLTDLKQGQAALKLILAAKMSNQNRAAVEVQ